MSKDLKKVLLGLSGGVDSTAAVLLLKERGFQVTGFYFDALGDQDKEAERAGALARDLGIDFLSRKIPEDFAREVIEPFCRAYEGGRTPNPCILCNPRIKFRVMLEAAEKVGADFLATGHYARVEKDPETRNFHVFKGVNPKRDQSYMLYRLPQEILSRLILPLGEIEEKEGLRDRLREEGLFNAEDRDSQDICFIREGTLADYMEARGCSGTPGDFVDRQGKVLGQHKGLPNYTIGQRKGLGNLGLGKPAFVLTLDSGKNQVVLGDNEDLFTDTVFAEDLFFSGYEPGILPEVYEGIRAEAKIRYAAAPAAATLTADGQGRICLKFDTPQRAATPGQSVVIYQDDKVLGGGFICR